MLDFFIILGYETGHFSHLFFILKENQIVKNAFLVVFVLDLLFLNLHIFNSAK